MTRALVWGLALLVPLPAAFAQEAKKADDAAMKIEGKLSADDPKDKMWAKSPHKVHEIKMTAGTAYQIDLASKAFDSFLRLEDAAGKELAQDDDSGGGLNARITFTAPKDGTYRVIVTNIDGKEGDYTLTVGTPSKAAVALAEVAGEQQKAMQEANRKYAQAKTQADKDKVLNSIFDEAAQLVERFAKVAQDFAGTPEARQALQMANQNLAMLARAKSPAVAKVLRNLVEKSADKSLQGQAAVALGHLMRNLYEKAYQDKNEKAPALYEEAEKTLTDLAKKFADNSGLESQFKDALFELEHLSVGKRAPDIDGEDLDGKKFKLSDYRGKVVVIDFWGNW
jgi:hypothetical protein